MPFVASDLKSSYNDGSNKLPKNSITSEKNDVNYSDKYSMQDNENNSQWQEYLDKNYKSPGSGQKIKEIKDTVNNNSKNTIYEKNIIQKSNENINKKERALKIKVLYEQQYIAKKESTKMKKKIKSTEEEQGIVKGLLDNNITLENRKYAHILDVSYHEDACRVYTKTAQENLNIFRKMGISIHKK